jgi:hypothetical protein
MADVLHIVPTGDAYALRVNRTARWLKGRKPHLVEKNLRTEGTRFMAQLCTAGVPFDEAKGQAAQFTRDVACRFFELTEAEQRPPCPVVNFKRNAA